MIDSPLQAASYKEAARDARLAVLKMVHRAGTSHIASNFSVIDIATVLYANVKSEDRIVWSCGWKAATIFYFLAQQGTIPAEALEKFPHEPYLGLAEPSVPGVHVAGGSMGHGLPVAVGMALAKKKAGEPGVVYCVMSDGEMNEGTTWESAAVAAHHKLDNLIVLVDWNAWQAMGKTKDVLDIDIESAFGGFGWLTMLSDGHDHDDIEASITWAQGRWGKPVALICDTIKGKGVSFMEDHLLFHYKHVTDEEYANAVAELS